MEWNPRGIRGGGALAMAIAVAASGCAPAAPQVRDPGCPFLDAPGTMLNSQRIERCFGSFGIEMLKPRDGLRVTRLYSGKWHGRVTRTLALTALEADPPQQLAPALARVEDGASLGSTLAAEGWSLSKQDFTVGRIEADPGLLVLAGFGTVPDGTPLALHAYRLVARRGGVSHLVARIAEVHHPDYLTPDRLAVLHPAPIPGDGADRQFLEAVMRVIE